MVWTVISIVASVNVANGLVNALFILTCDLFCVALGVIWVICKYKYPNSKFYCYFGVIQYNFVGIWLNLVTRSMIPESFAVFGKSGYRSLLDFNRFNYVITAALMMHDFKINLLVLFPSFLIQTYFLTDIEVSLITEADNESWKSEQQKMGYYVIILERAFFLGLVIITSNYFTQKEFS